MLIHIKALNLRFLLKVIHLAVRIQRGSCQNRIKTVVRNLSSQAIVPITQSFEPMLVWMDKHAQCLKELAVNSNFHSISFRVLVSLFDTLFPPVKILNIWVSKLSQYNNSFPRDSFGCKFRDYFSSS